MTKTIEPVAKLPVPAPPVALALPMRFTRSLAIGSIICLMLTSMLSAVYPQEVDLENKPLSAELKDPGYLQEVCRFLYLWHLEEEDVAVLARNKNLEVWIETRHYQMDEGDQSQFATIIFPVLKLKVLVKKSDYLIPELGAEVKSDGFKIHAVVHLKTASNAATTDEGLTRPPGATAVSMDMPTVMEKLFAARNRWDFPDETLQRRIAVELHKTSRAEEWLRRRDQAESGRQLIYLAPMSPVANDAWIFWETGRLLLHVTSDFDLRGGDASWREQHLKVKTYDLDEQVVLSPDETPASNAYLSRHHVGRVLYNCVILGKREYRDKLPQDGKSSEPSRGQPSRGHTPAID